jgi:hypothetical protein
MLAVVGVLSACGGTPKDGGTTTAGGGTAKPAAAGDVSLDIPMIKIEGVVFEPEALGRPGMPLYQPKNKKLTIDQQKKIFGAEKNLVVKQAQAAVLATMLYDESKKQTGQAQKDLVNEARQVLRTVAAAAGAKVDEVTVRMLGSYEIQLEDWAAAEKAWESLAKDTKSKEHLENKAWWAYTLLKQYKNAEALAAVKADPVSEKQPLHAYATAWAKFRAGDDAGAWQAIAAAAAGWGTNANKDALERDVLLFAGRSSVTPAQVTPQLFTVFGAKQPNLQYEVLVKLGLFAYQFAGRWTEGVSVLDEALKVAGATVPPNDKVRIKYNQAQFTVPLDQPEAASRAAKEAIAALPACGTKCSAKETQDLVTAVYGIGKTFHLLYATANDIRYYQPAQDLYNTTIPLIQDTAMRTQAKEELAKLEKTLKNTKVGTGTHEKQAIAFLLGRHNQEVQACYEESLAANPKLAGQITIDLESDASGAINGASSEPKAGVADLSAVAGCVVTTAKQWKLPKRGMAGNTRIKLVYTFSKKPAAVSGSSTSI